ncbi:MAG: DUF3007 family protein [Christensenellaceae bacterium]|jgi:hypothetical protein|nr:DUF3007 family protein [Christensenellaceae bacterium]
MRKPEPQLVGLLLFAALYYLLLHDLLGGSLLAHSTHDSYTLQALCWQDGRLDIPSGEVYTWLELAIYNDKYYLSFPPLPSLFLLPWVAIFDAETPSNLIVALYAVASLGVLYACLRVIGLEENRAAIWAVPLLLGSSLAWVSSSGAVWFQAQTLNTLLLLIAILCLLKGRQRPAFFWLALAVGCRPVSIVYFPAFIALFWAKDPPSRAGSWRFCRGLFFSLIPAALVGLFYMALNLARFSNPLEFGHSYLPEFTRNPRFSPAYLAHNLSILLFRPLLLGGGLRVNLNPFEGFAFYLANPVFCCSSFAWRVSCAQSTWALRKSPFAPAFCSA